MKEPINKVDKDAVSLVRTNFYCKGKVVVYVRQKYMIVSLHFHGTEKAIRLAKN